nr:bifunctional ADP-dependent NAD(P)H-hydrate dehydratase/NAD(P)H-hydrate epimerase [Prolixibacteraceae bacterium]
MMKLFTTNQIAAIDRYTIEHEPVTDIDLMERAALKMTNHLGAYIRYRHPLVFFAGPGNNGGDALAMARLYAGEGYPVTAYLLDTGRSLSPSCETNRQRLLDQGKARFRTIAAEKDFPEIPRQAAVIDGLFGAGLTRPLEALPAALVRHLNASGTRIYAIDMPSGLLGEDNSQTNPDHIIRARATFTLQFPKISLLFPENEAFAGRVEIVDIGLHPHALARTESPFRMTTPEELRGLFPLRKRFAHKGAFGHALLIAGSYGKTGAALLAAQGCLRSGAGLVTIHTPRCGLPILQAAAPEAMCSVDPHEEHFTQLPPTGKYAAIGVGPGLGTDPLSGTALRELLQTARTPLL